MIAFAMYFFFTIWHYPNKDDDDFPPTGAVPV